MNDFDYDALQKKRIANNAHRMNRTKPGCHLPCDNLTEAQIRKKHGEVFSMNIDKPMSYEDWKKLPEDMKIEYYNALVARFHVGAGSIAEMFGCNKPALANYIFKHKMESKLVKIKGRPSPKKIEQFREWWQGTQEIVPETVHLVEIGTETVTAQDIAENPKQGWIPKNEEKRKDSQSFLTNYHLHFAGVNEWQAVFDVLEVMALPKDAVITINVSKGVSYESNYAE